MNLKFLQKIITMLVFVASASLWAQIERNFVPANPPHTQNIRGEAVLIGNRSIKPRPGPYGRVGQLPVANVQQRRTNHGPVNGAGVGNHPYDQTKVQWKFDYKHQPHIPVNDAAYNESPFGEKGNNSSKATLTIPANSRIVWAGLYWTGMLRTPLSTPKGTNTGDIVEARKWVKFKHSSDTNYQTIRAYDQDPSMIDPLKNNAGIPTYVPEHTNSIFFTDRVETYVGFADVTEYVKQYGVGEYTVADVKADLYYEGGNYTNSSNGVTKHYDKDFDPFVAQYGQVPESIGPYLEYNFGAGWSLAVIYENETLPSRLIKLYNGKAAVSPLNPAKPTENNTTVELNVFQNNFLTPETGAINPVLYGMASGGDWNNNVGTGDRMEIFNTQTNTWEKVYANVGNSPTGAVVPNKEFFSGEVIPSGNSVYSNSATVNTGKHSAFDMVMAYPDNTGKQYFTNSQTSSNLRFVVDDDYVNLFMVGASFESYFPIPHATIERVGNTTFSPTASFSVKLYNKGEEALKQTVLYIPMPYPIIPKNFNTNGLGTATFVNATSIPADAQTNSDTPRGYNTPEIPTPYGYIKWEINTSVPNDATGTPFTRKGELTFDVDMLTNNCANIQELKFGGTIRGIGEKSELKTQGIHSILNANDPDNGASLTNSTAKPAQAPLLCDTDDDKIPDLIDEDDDNDGIPDVEECDSNLLKNGEGEFYKKNHTRNDVVDFDAMGWQVSGTYDSNSPWTNAQPVLHIDNKKTGEIVENSGLLFQREYSTQSSIQRNIDFGTITQPPLVVLKGFSYSRKQTAAPPLRVEFTISYNGVDYLRIHTSNRIVQPLNGASVVNGVTEITNPTQTNRFEHLQDIYLQLPATISTTGDFKMSMKSGPVSDGDDISIQEVQILTRCDTDTDGDGTPDYLDTDSDNDGCPDALEGNDANLKTNDVQEGRITGNVNSQGIPTKVNGGQQKGSAQVASQEIKTDLPATISICEGESNEAKSVVFAVETSVFKDENGVRVPDYDQGSFVETLGKWEEKIAGGTWQDFTGDANVSTEKSYNNTTGLTEFKLKFTNVPFSKNGMEYRLSVWTGNKKCLQETSIKLEVNKKPTEPILTGTRTICASVTDNNISFADFVQVEAEHSLVWYADNNATTSAETTTPTYNTKTPTTGKSYWVAYKNDTIGCIGARTEVKLVVNALPVTPTLKTTPREFCKTNDSVEKQFADFVQVEAGHSLVWYETENATSELDATDSKLKINTNTAGTTSRWVAYKSDTTSCIGARTEVELVVNALPVTPTLKTTPREFCKTTNSVEKQFADFVQVEAGHSLVWYETENATSELDATDSKLKINTNTAGTTSRWVAYKSDTTSCIGARTEVELVVNALPVTPTLKTTPREFCKTTNSVEKQFADFVQTEAGHSLVWYETENATSELDATDSKLKINTNTAGTTSRWVAYKSDTTSCIGARTEVKLVVNALPTKPSVGTITQPSCNVDKGKVTLSNLPSGNWTIIYGNTEVTGTGTSKEITDLTAGAYKFKVKNASGCISEETEEIEIKAYVDTEKPVVTAPAKDLKLDCKDEDFETKVQNWLATAGITDNCDTNPTKGNDYATKKAAITNLCETGEIEIIFTGTDKTGNTGTPVTKKIKLISAKDDTGTAISSTSEDVKAKDGNGTTLNVLKNKPDASSTENVDKINGEEATIDNVTITSTETNELKIDTTTGEVIVKQGTPAGSYTIEYTICDKATGTLCSTANVSVEVTTPSVPPTPTSTIKAEKDIFNVSNKGGTTPSVLDNRDGKDTLNGKTPTPSEVIITNSEILDPNGNPTTAISFDTNIGKVTVPDGTPEGTYTFTYTICEKDGNGVSNGNCSTADVAINVSKVTAQNDTFNVSNKGGETPSVLDNKDGKDTLNGKTPTPSEVVITNTTILDPNGNPTTAISFDTNTGKVTVPDGTPEGTYTFTYTICEKDGNGVSNGNCSTADVAINVSKVTAQNDTFNVSNKGGTTPSILNNDKINDKTPTGNDVIIVVTQTPTGTIVPSLDITTGKVNVPSGTPSGTYIFKYRICEKDAKGNIINDKCSDEVEVKIIVGDCELEFYNGISPDQNDSENDTFVIKGLECYPDNTLKIFNRWGVLIYEKTGYDNSFNGYSTGRVTISKDKKEVPTGTYYYVFEYKDQNGNTHRKAGWLYKL